MKFTVDRKTWFHGRGTGAFLLYYDGKRCCIGFVAQQCGITNEDILMIGTISSINSQENIRKVPQWMQADNVESSGGINEAYNINDDILISDDEREMKLKALFLKNGDEIEFI
jgi:hypothetical protein